MYQIKVNEVYNYETGRTGDNLSLNNENIAADIKQLGDLSWHVINDLRSYNVEVINFNSAEKTAEIKVNNNLYKIKPLKTSLIYCWINWA